MSTKIEWASETWNPVTGCTPVSEGCEHCYARRMAQRLRGRFGYPEDDPFRPGVTHGNKRGEPLNWQQPRKIFVCSMGDLFHGLVSIADQTLVMNMAKICQQHTFIVLTKRPENVPTFWSARRNLWMGVSVENQRAADERIPLLLDIPAAVRFVSCEPLLDWVDLDSWINYLDWVICGGETGPGARKMEREWAYLLRDQSIISHTPFFFKRWGSAYGKKNTREMCGREWNQWPEGGKP